MRRVISADEPDTRRSAARRIEMDLFKSKAEKELDAILADLRGYLGNNYKDMAHDSRKSSASAASGCTPRGSSKRRPI